jgi:hypothetical protein
LHEDEDDGFAFSEIAKVIEKFYFCESEREHKRKSPKMRGTRLVKGRKVSTCSFASIPYLLQEAKTYQEKDFLSL